MNQEDMNDKESSSPLNLQNFHSTEKQNEAYESNTTNETNEKDILEQIKFILYQENVSDEELIFQLLAFFDKNKNAINAQVIRNTFAMIMSLYTIDSVEDLKRSMASAYDEGPSHRLAKKTQDSKNEILQFFEKNKKNFTSEKNQDKLQQILKELVLFTIDTAPHMNEDKDLSLRYKIVTGFIGKLLGHMGQFQIDMLLELIRWLFPELDEKTAQIFGSDIWFYANGVFKKKKPL